MSFRVLAIPVSRLARSASVSTATGLGGAGRKACAGTCPPKVASKRRCQRSTSVPRPELHRTATCLGTISSARTSRLESVSSRRRTDVVAAKGRLATTLNGCAGRRKAVTSAWITRTGAPRYRSRSDATRSGWSSTATTRAPARSRWSVTAPSPAPRSRTSSQGWMSARRTSRRAHSSESR